MSTDKRLPAPKTMSAQAIEDEISRLVSHEQEQAQCARTRCDGQPHEGAPFPHAPRLPAEATPIDEAALFDPGYVKRSHLTYLSERLAAAVKDVEQGQDRNLIVSMPPRMGKSQLCSVYLPTWLLHKHPDWSIGMISHSPTLAAGWGRQVRRVVEENADIHGLHIADDAGAISNWETTQHGGVVARSAPGQSIIGLGFKVLLVDDPVKDFASAHSQTDRDALWDWWTGNAIHRLEPPSLVVMVATRWHEDDLLGRLTSSEYVTDPGAWEQITFPALAESSDVLDRSEGDPLYSPLVPEETTEAALARWEKLRTSVGSYTWSALFQQRPAPSKGAVFDRSWWRYWTVDPSRVTDDGTVVYLNPLTLSGGRWTDSWDFTFKGGGTDTDYVVGQRWVKYDANRYLVAQQRARMSFTQTIRAMWNWADPATFTSYSPDARLPNPTALMNPGGQYVHERLVEDSANGPAIIDTLSDKISGIKPITPRESKEARARAVTPEVESGNVYLPHPEDPGNEWVTDLLDELRNFPMGLHDDQVDVLSQYLNYVRTGSGGQITVPGASADQRLTSSRVPSTLVRRGTSSGQAWRSAPIVVPNRER